MKWKCIYSIEIYFMKSKLIYSIEIYYFQSKFTYEIYVSLLNRSSFIFDIEIRLIEWKFVLSNQSLSYPSITKKKIIVKVCSFFAVESNWQLRGLFVLVAEQKKRITLIGDNTFTEREVVGNYFHCGYDYRAIVHLLKTHCNISLSQRTLKRRLQKYNLRKNSNTDDSVLRTIINRELETRSQCLGYRGMWHLLRKSYSI